MSKKKITSEETHNLFVEHTMGKVYLRQETYLPFRNDSSRARTSAGERFSLFADTLKDHKVFTIVDPFSSPSSSSGSSSGNVLSVDYVAFTQPLYLILGGGWYAFLDLVFRGKPSSSGVRYARELPSFRIGPSYSVPWTLPKGVTRQTYLESFLTTVQAVKEIADREAVHIKAEKKKREEVDRKVVLAKSLGLKLDPYLYLLQTPYPQDPETFDAFLEGLRVLLKKHLPSDTPGV